VIEVGVDTWRSLWKADASSAGGRVVDLDGGYRGQWIPSLGLLAVEGHPEGPQVLARPECLGEAFERVTDAVRPFGGAFAGFSRVDLTVTRRFPTAAEGRAFFAGVAAIELPRCETSRRGHPVHSVWWTGIKGRAVKARVYDKGLERGSAEAFELGRMEDQRRLPSGSRPGIEEVSDASWCRERFGSRFGRVAEAVEGVRAATLPVIARALADEVQYGYRPLREAVRLGGSLLLLSGGADRGDRGTAQERWFYRARRELRESGFTLVDDLEAVEVDLSAPFEEAMGAW
jgi:hypothetical protein